MKQFSPREAEVSRMRSGDVLLGEISCLLRLPLPLFHLSYSWSPFPFLRGGGKCKKRDMCLHSLDKSPLLFRYFGSLKFLAISTFSVRPSYVNCRLWHVTGLTIHCQVSVPGPSPTRNLPALCCSFFFYGHTSSFRHEEKRNSTALAGYTNSQNRVTVELLVAWFLCDVCYYII